MIMFASDLDRTLIYSERALADFHQSGVNNLVGVERKADRDIAFMTRTSMEALSYIAANLLFVPVTTRTFDQYNRIYILSKSIPITYAITSNGANIIYNGRSNVDWGYKVQKRLKAECDSLEDMIGKINKFHIRGIIKKAEEFFFYYILDEAIDKETINMIKLVAVKSGWRVSLQGRKMYFMPKPICKGEAVKFIKEREGISNVYGAGDSLLDHDFLKACDFPYVPSHGELANEHLLLQKMQYTFTKEKGVKAGEEILANIMLAMNHSS